MMTWTYDAPSDKIQFNIAAKTDVNKWTGVGFSELGQMVCRKTYKDFCSSNELF